MFQKITLEMEVDQRIVLPGDVIDVDTESTVVLGPGLRQEGEEVVATKAGMLRHLEVGNRWWIESNQKRVKSFNTKKKEQPIKYTLYLVHCSHWRISHWNCHSQNGRILSR